VNQPKNTSLLCVGCITGPQGIQGEVKVRTFTEDPFDVVSYGPLMDETGAPLFKLHLLHQTQDAVVIAKIDGVTTRNQAETYKNIYLYVSKDRLPTPEEEETYYHADLIGLKVLDLKNNSLGVISEVHDFGAGILLEMQKEGSDDTLMIPFRKDTVPTVDLKSGMLQVDKTHLAEFE
jgi:16S rRNA processing protein RimM